MISLWNLTLTLFMNKSDAETLWGLLSQSRGIAIDADLNEEVGPNTVIVDFLAPQAH